MTVSYQIKNQLAIDNIIFCTISSVYASYWCRLFKWVFVESSSKEAAINNSNKGNAI